MEELSLKWLRERIGYVGQVRYSVLMFASHSGYGCISNMRTFFFFDLILNRSHAFSVWM